MNSKEAWTRMTNLVRREGYSAQKPVNPARYNEAYFTALNRAVYIARSRKKGSFVLGSEGVIQVSFSNDRYKLTPVDGTYRNKAVAVNMAEINEQQLNDPNFRYDDPFYPDPSRTPQMAGHFASNPLIRDRGRDGQQELVAEAIRIADKPLRRFLRRGGLILANTGGVYEIFRTKSSPSGYDVRYVIDMKHPRQLTETPNRDVAIMHFRRLLDQAVPPKGTRR